MKQCIAIAFLFSLVALAQGRFVAEELNGEPKMKQDVSERNDPFYDSLRCKGKNSNCCTLDNPCPVGDGDCDSTRSCARDLVCGSNNCEQQSGMFQPTDDCCFERRPPGFETAQCGYYSGFIDGFAYGNSWEKVGKMTNVNWCMNICAKRRENEPQIIGMSYAKSASQTCYCLLNKGYKAFYMSKPTKYQTCWYPYLDASGLRCQGANNGCCTKENPCGLHDGDCDYDYECAGNLVCGKNNCAWGKGDDCCKRRHVGDELLTEIEQAEFEQITEEE